MIVRRWYRSKEGVCHSLGREPRALNTFFLWLVTDSSCSSTTTITTSCSFPASFRQARVTYPFSAQLTPLAPLNLASASRGNRNVGSTASTPSMQRASLLHVRTKGDVCFTIRYLERDILRGTSQLISPFAAQCRQALSRIQ